MQRQHADEHASVSMLPISVERPLLQAQRAAIDAADAPAGRVSPWRGALVGPSVAATPQPRAPDRTGPESVGLPRHPHWVSGLDPGRANPQAACSTDHSARASPAQGRNERPTLVEIAYTCPDGLDLSTEESVPRVRAWRGTPQFRSRYGSRTSEGWTMAHPVSGHARVLS